MRALALAAAIGADRVPARGDACARAPPPRAAPAGDPRGFWQVFAAELLLSTDFEAGAAALDRLTTDRDPLIAAFALLMRAQLEENSGTTAAARRRSHRRRGDRPRGTATRGSGSSLGPTSCRCAVSAASTRRALADARRAAAGDPRPRRRRGSPPARLADRRERDRHRRARRGASGSSPSWRRPAAAAAPRTRRTTSRSPLAGLAEVATARGDRGARPAAVGRGDRGRAAGRRRPGGSSSTRQRSPAASTLGVPTAELERPYRRLRTPADRAAAAAGRPVRRAGARRRAGRALGGAAPHRCRDGGRAGRRRLALGARRDLASIDAAVRGGRRRRSTARKPHGGRSRCCDRPPCGGGEAGGYAFRM